jgi:hypothetical protein
MSECGRSYRTRWQQITLGGGGSVVDAVKKMIPPNHVAILSNRRLPIGPQTEGMRRGEVRKVEP